MGGTRFMGIRLVEQMIDKNWFITLATRGVHKDSFGKNVTRIKLDRKNHHKNKKGPKKSSQIKTMQRAWPFF